LQQDEELQGQNLMQLDPEKSKLESKALDEDEIFGGKVLAAIDTTLSN